MALEEWADPVQRDKALERVIAKVDAAPLVTEESLGSVVSGRIQGDPSPAELRVLDAFSHGRTNQGVADLLGWSPETVKTQTKHARFLLQAKTTTEACCEALRRGLIR
jgi:DNA-binding NarL/FixJ family response regulator